MTEIMEQFLHTARARVRQHRAIMPMDQARDLASERPAPPDMLSALRASAGVDGVPALIAEVARWSPSHGELRPKMEVPEVCAELAAGGAAAISVLTEPRFFGGSVLDLKAASERVDVPTMMKDFVIDEHQLHMARVAGGSAVLLMMSALSDDAEYADLFRRSDDLGLEPLVEVHSEEELERAFKDVQPRLLGVNNSDLGTLEVSLDVFERLSRLVPEGVLRVAESGIQTEADVRRMSDAGADAILVGYGVLKSPDLFLSSNGRSAA